MTRYSKTVKTEILLMLLYDILLKSICNKDQI